MKTLLMSMRGTQAETYNEKRNSIAYDYIEFFELLEFKIYLIPNNSIHIQEYFNSKIDLVVLSGGNNVNPKLYNNDDKLKDIYPERDLTETFLIEQALERSIPILGICRGFHFLNIYFGGNLSHNIENHVTQQHILSSDINILNNQEVNSFHNQGIQDCNLSKEVEIIAQTEDQLIEAFIYREKHTLALQWHPERQNKIFDKKIIIKFLEGTL